jgi:hypothetical protein
MRIAVISIGAILLVPDKRRNCFTGASMLSLMNWNGRGTRSWDQSMAAGICAT